MQSANFILQQAVYQTLRDDAELTTLLGGAKIYDPVPSKVELPYVSFGPSLSAPQDTVTETIDRCELTINIWSRCTGIKQASAISARVQELLHDRALAVTSGTCVQSRIFSAQVTHDRKNEIYRTILQVRALLQRED